MAYFKSPGFIDGLFTGWDGLVEGLVLGRVVGRLAGLVLGPAAGLEEGCDGRVEGLVMVLALVLGREEVLVLGRVARVVGLDAGLARDPVIGVRWLLALRDGLAEELRPPPPLRPLARPPPRASNIGIAMSVTPMRHNNCLLQIFSRLSFILLL